MGTKAKKKLCWNCEGNVSLKDELCPYCGVSLDITPIPGTAGTDNHALLPPYKLTTPHQEQPIPLAPYPTQEILEERSENKEEKTLVSNPEPRKGNEEIKEIVLPLTTILLGAVLVLFSFLLYIFSDSRGIFTLHWNGSYWYVYLLIGLPLLFFGWRASSPTIEQEEALEADKEQ